jgi:hypothetical protein
MSSPKSILRARKSTRLKHQNEAQKRAEMLKRRRMLLEQLEDRSLMAIAISDATAREGNLLSFTVSLSAASTETVTVDFETANDSAAAGFDYVASSGTIVFVPGQTSQQVHLATIQDLLSETSEAFSVQLTNPVNSTISDDEGVATITDNDPIPALTVADRKVSESASTVIITVRLSAVSGQDVTVEYDTSNGTATAGDDYLGTTDTLTIPAGNASGTVNVSLIGDVELEENETFTFTISSPDNATIADSSGTVTILDDEPRPLVSVQSAQGAIEGAQPGYVRLKRTGSTSEALSITYQIDPDNSAAINGTDVELLPGTTTEELLVGAVTFPIGESTIDIPIDAVADATIENAESFRIFLIDQSNLYNLANPSFALIQIHDEGAVSLPAVSIGERVAEVQHVVVPAASDGTWTLALDFEETDPIDFDATAADVQTALEELTGIGSGNVEVTGAGTMTNPFAVRFVGALEAIDVGTLIADDSGLASYTLLPSASVTVQTEGVDGDNEVFEILIRSRDDGSPLDDSLGRLLFSWGTWNPPPGSSATDPRLSDPIDWDASVGDFKDAIEAIPAIIAANGMVQVTEVESTTQLRRLQVEFLGGLSNRDIIDAMVFNDAAEPIEDENGLDASVLGSTVVSGVQGTTNEVQVVELDNVQGGVIRIGETSDPEAGWFAFDADGATVQAALEQTDIGSGNVEVSGPAGGPWTITFQGSLAGRNVDLLEVDVSEAEYGDVLVTAIRDGGAAVDATSDSYEGKPNGARQSDH